MSLEPVEATWYWSESGEGLPAAELELIAVGKPSARVNPLTVIVLLSKLKPDPTLSLPP